MSCDWPATWSKTHRTQRILMFLFPLRETGSIKLQPRSQYIHPLGSEWRSGEGTRLLVVRVEKIPLHRNFLCMLPSVSVIDESQSCGKITLNPTKKVLCCYSHDVFWQFWSHRVCPIFVICWADHNVDCDWAKDSGLSGNVSPPKHHKGGYPSSVLTMVHLPLCLHG